MSDRRGGEAADLDTHLGGLPPFGLKKQPEEWGTHFRGVTHTERLFLDFHNEVFDGTAGREQHLVGCVRRNMSDVALV